MSFRNGPYSGTPLPPWQAGRRAGASTSYVRHPLDPAMDSSNEALSEREQKLVEFARALSMELAYERQRHANTVTKARTTEATLKKEIRSLHSD